MLDNQMMTNIWEDQVNRTTMMMTRACRRLLGVPLTQPADSLRDGRGSYSSASGAHPASMTTPSERGVLLLQSIMYLPVPRNQLDEDVFTIVSLPPDHEVRWRAEKAA